MVRKKSNMWTQGKQPERNKIDIIKEAELLPDIISEEDAKVFAARFLCSQLGIFFNLLTGNNEQFKLLKIQEILLDIWFKRDFNLIVAGRGFSKSALIAVFSILYCILNPNSKVVIVASVFRRVKDIFNYMDRFFLMPDAFLLRACFEKKWCIKNADQYILKALNGAQVKGLPLSGEGLRGERANLLIVDEGLLVSKHIQETILTPFLTAAQDIGKSVAIKEKEDELILAGLMTEEDRYVPPKNKMLIASSASFKFEYLFKGIYLPYLESIFKDKLYEKNSPLYSVIRASYESLPPGSIMDDTVIKMAKEGKYDTPGFMREYRALFMDGSDSYFDIEKLHQCTVPDNELPCVEIIGYKTSEYLMTIDPAYGKSEAGDYFAFGIYKLVPEQERLISVHNYGEVTPNVNEHYKYLIYLLKQFKPVMISMDDSGTEFIEGFNNSVIAQQFNINLKFLDVNFDTEGEEYVDNLNKCRTELNQESGKIIYRQKFQNKINLRMNQHLQNAIYESKIWFASRISLHTPSFNKAKIFKMPFDFAQFQYKEEGDAIGTFNMLRFLSDQDDMIQETKDQLGLIEVQMTVAGSYQFNIPHHMRKSSDADRPRRDNYTCLLMAATAAKHYFAVKNAPPEPEYDTTIIPRMF